MTITVRYYAVLRDLTGQNVETIEVPQDCDAGVLLERIVKRHPEVARFASFLRLATETEYISTDTVLTGSGEISVIPPVSGG
jgi:molybdopterin converting factor subunit 1